MSRMSPNTLSRGMIVAACGWLPAACAPGAENPTAPIAVEPAASVAGSAGKAVASTTRTSATVRVLRRLRPVGAPVEAEATIGPAGGELSLPSLGLTLVVPPGAVTSATRFQVTARPGRELAYEFAPHGMQFKRPLQLRQRLAVTTWVPGPVLGGGYFKNAKQIGAGKGEAKVDEVLPAWIGIGEVGLDLWHFPGYLVSMA